MILTGLGKNCWPDLVIKPDGLIVGNIRGLKRYRLRKITDEEGSNHAGSCSCPFCGRVLGRSDYSRPDGTGAFRQRDDGNGDQRWFHDEWRVRNWLHTRVWSIDVLNG